MLHQQAYNELTSIYEIYNLGNIEFVLCNFELYQRLLWHLFVYAAVLTRVEIIQHILKIVTNTQALHRNGYLFISLKLQLKINVEI